MKPAVWLILLFALASGLSAWIGNDWGRLIGKRKLTVFALRPKHTSLILTILLSISLSMGCLGLYLLVDGNAREALLNPESRAERQTRWMTEQTTAFNSTLQRLRQRVSEGGDLKLATAAQPSRTPARSAPAVTVVSARAPERLAARAVPAEDEGWDAVDSERPLRVAAARPQRQAATQTTAQTSTPTPASAQPHGPAAPQPSPRMAPAAPRRAEVHALEAQVASGSLAPHRQVPVQTALLAEPVFQLRVYGGRSAEESRQILDGVLSMTRAFARDVGLTTANDPLNVPMENLTQSRRALQKAKVYQLQVRVGRISDDSQALPVRLVLKAEARNSLFDPQTLLEQDRLNPDGEQSLHADLRQAILALAEETRSDLMLESPSELYSPDAGIATAELPIRIMQLHRTGNTLHGQIVLLANAANLTEN